MYNVRIHKSITEIDKTTWNNLAQDNIFICYEWLKTFECSSVFPVDSYYVMIFDKENFVGASVCYFEKRKEYMHYLDPVLLGRIMRFKWTKHLSFLPAVICSPRRGFGAHFLVSKEINQGEINLIQDKLLDTIEEIAANKKASICFYNVLDKEKNLIQLLTNRGYSKTFGMPLNYIDINWPSFDEYKKHIKQKYHLMNKKISNEINRNLKSGVTIERLQNLDDNQRLFELIKMNHNKYYDTIFPLKSDYFHQLKENFGNNAMIWVATKMDKIIGLVVKLRKGNESVLTNIGVDHESSGNDFTYFTLAFYEPIKNAIETHIKRIYAGNALYKLKAKRGYSTTNAYIFYKSNNRLKYFFIKMWFVIHKLWMIRKFSYLKHF